MNTENKIGKKEERVDNISVEEKNDIRERKHREYIEFWTNFDDFEKMWEEIKLNHKNYQPKTPEEIHYQNLSSENKFHHLTRLHAKNHEDISFIDKLKELAVCENNLSAQIFLSILSTHKNTKYGRREAIAWNKFTLKSYRDCGSYDRLGIAYAYEGLFEEAEIYLLEAINLGSKSAAKLLEELKNN